MVTLVDSGFLRSAILQKVNGEVIHHIEKTDRLLIQAHKTSKFYKLKLKTSTHRQKELRHKIHA